MAGELAPGNNFFLFFFGDSFPPNDCGIENSSNHIKPITLWVRPYLIRPATFVPAIQKEIIDSIINFAFISNHKIELINYCNHVWNMPPEIRTHCHRCKLINSIHKLWAKTIRVIYISRISISATLNSLQVGIRYIKPKLNLGHIN